jgi:hypothetical protein
MPMAHPTQGLAASPAVAARLHAWASCHMRRCDGTAWFPILTCYNSTFKHKSSRGVYQVVGILLFCCTFEPEDGRATLPKQQLLLAQRAADNCTVGCSLHPGRARRLCTAAHRGWVAVASCAVQHAMSLVSTMTLCDPVVTLREAVEEQGQGRSPAAALWRRCILREG